MKTQPKKRDACLRRGSVTSSRKRRKHPVIIVPSNGCLTHTRKHTRACKRHDAGGGHDDDDDDDDDGDRHALTCTWRTAHLPSYEGSFGVRG